MSRWLRSRWWWYRSEVLGQTAIVPLITGGMTDPTVDQNAWAEIEDDGDENNGTITSESASDGGFTRTVGIKFRIRIEMDHTAGDSANARTFTLQYNHSAAPGWNTVTTTTPIQAVASDDAGAIDGDSTTTNRITATGASAQTYKSGLFESSSGATGSYSLTAANHTEHEYCVVIDSAQVSDADTIQLRCLMSGAVTALTYGATPTVTVDKPASTGQGLGWMGLTGMGI